MGEIAILRERTLLMLQKCLEDTDDPEGRMMGEMDCRVELKMLEEME